MKAKLSRGPMKNQRVAVPDDTYKYRIAVPVFKDNQLDWAANYEISTELKGYTIREGEYHKSFSRLADGTVIFEWMGFYDGKI